jgi:hypothetical protein
LSTAELAPYAGMTLIDMYTRLAEGVPSVPMRDGCPVDVITGSAIHSITEGVCAFQAHLINLLDKGVVVHPHVAQTLWCATREIDFCYRRAIRDDERFTYRGWKAWDGLGSAVRFAFCKRFPSVHDEGHSREISWAELHELAGCKVPFLPITTYRAFRWDYERFLFAVNPAFPRHI